jgi:hypothetical protein
MDMKKLSILLLFLSAVLFSCKKDDAPNFGKGTSMLSFKLTDAPGDFDKVNIDIVGLEAIVNDSVINMQVNAGVYNLLDFVNGKDTVLVDQQIPSGTLSQIRLILGDNNTIKVGNETYKLTTPSAQQSGLKLNVHADFQQGVAYEYTIDFDAARSIVETGSGKYILKPVLKVFTNSISGAIKGIVAPAKAKPVILAISSHLDTASVFADTTSGKYMFRGLAEGTYKLRFLPLIPYKDSTLSNIVVKNGAVTVLDTLKFK